jgi:50S ribosomal subunit-associated GTPase HflX
LKDKATLTVLNKRDRVAEAWRLEALVHAHQPAVAISAKTGEAIERLQELIAEQLELVLAAPTRLRIPAERADLIAHIYHSGQVIARQETEGAVELTVRLSAKSHATLMAYILS